MHLSAIIGINLPKGIFFLFLITLALFKNFIFSIVFKLRFNDESIPEQLCNIFIFKVKFLVNKNLQKIIFFFNLKQVLVNILLVSIFTYI